MGVVRLIHVAQAPSRSSRFRDSDHNGVIHHVVMFISGGTSYGHYSPMPSITLIIILGILAIVLWAIRTGNTQQRHHVIDSANYAIMESEIDNNIVTIKAKI